MQPQSTARDEQHSASLQKRTIPVVTAVPETQTVLLLHGPRQAYQLTQGYAVPQVQSEHDVLVKVQAIGLNPIDWKAP